MDNSKKKHLEENPQNRASMLSKLTFWWVRDLYRKGMRKTITSEDIYQTKQSQKSELIADKFTLIWNEELKKENPSVLLLIYKAYGYMLLPIGLIFSIFESILRCVQPLFFGALLSYFSEGKEMPSYAYLYGAGMILCSLIPVIAYHPFSFYSMETAMKVKIGLTRLIYDKVEN
jgi:ATP-binding cassette, subfamily C (CFTR/MRP), member 4